MTPPDTSGSRGLQPRSRPDVIVEIGLPGWRPDGVLAWIETNGAGRVNLEAAAEVIAPDAVRR